jgi:hypothetical protein
MILKDRDNIENSIDSNAIWLQRKKIHTANNEEVDNAAYKVVSEYTIEEYSSECVSKLDLSLSVTEFYGRTGQPHRFQEC